MARAPRTGFYFEPISERLVLVVEGFAFPSDDAWAFIGDPVEISPDVARLHVAMRWPGVDPEALMVEFDTNFERAVAEMERLQREEREKEPGSGEIDFDVNKLLQMAEQLKEAAANLRVPTARDVEEALEKQSVGEAIASAHGAGATSEPDPDPGSKKKG